MNSRDMLSTVADFRGRLFRCSFCHPWTRMAVKHREFIEQDRPSVGDEIIHQGNAYRVQRVVLLDDVIEFDLEKV